MASKVAFIVIHALLLQFVTCTIIFAASEEKQHVKQPSEYKDVTIHKEEWSLKEVMSMKMYLRTSRKVQMAGNWQESKLYAPRESIEDVNDFIDKEQWQKLHKALNKELDINDVIKNNSNDDNNNNNNGKIELYEHQIKCTLPRHISPRFALGKTTHFSRTFSHKLLEAALFDVFKTEVALLSKIQEQEELQRRKTQDELGEHMTTSTLAIRFGLEHASKHETVWLPLVILKREGSKSNTISSNNNNNNNNNEEEINKAEMQLFNGIKTDYTVKYLRGVSFYFTIRPMSLVQSNVFVIDQLKVRTHYHSIKLTASRIMDFLDTYSNENDEGVLTNKLPFSTFTLEYNWAEERMYNPERGLYVCTVICVIVAVGLGTYIVVNEWKRLASVGIPLYGRKSRNNNNASTSNKSHNFVSDVKEAKE